MIPSRGDWPRPGMDTPTMARLRDTEPGRALVRNVRKIFIWPLEAALVVLIFGAARLLPL